LKIPNR